MSKSTGEQILTKIEVLSAKQAETYTKQAEMSAKQTEMSAKQAEMSAKQVEMSSKQAEMYAKQSEISKDVNNLKSVVAAVGIVISMLVAGSRYFTIVPTS